VFVDLGCALSWREYESYESRSDGSAEFDLPDPPVPTSTQSQFTTQQVGRDIGEQSLLRDYYETPRQRANLGMMASLESIQRLFCAGGGALGAARAAGLGAVNATGPLKNQLMRYAMGMSLL